MERNRNEGRKACGGSCIAPTPTPTAGFKLDRPRHELRRRPGGRRDDVVLNGANANQSATTDSAGRYTFASLHSSGFSVRATLDGFTGLTKPLKLTADGTLDFHAREDSAGHPDVGSRGAR